MADEPQLPLEAPAGTPAADVVSFADLKATLGDTYFTDKGFDADGLKANLTELGTLKQQAADRAAGVPQDGKYDFGLPKDWKAPDGIEISKEVLDSWNISEGRQSVLQKYFAKHNLSQAEAAEIISDLASADLPEKLNAGKTAADAAKVAEDATKADAVKVLGANYTEVVANTRNAMQALFVEKLGKEAGERLTKNMGFQSAQDIKDMAALINALNSNLAPNAPSGGGTGNGVEFKPGMGRKLLDIANTTTKN